MAQKETKKNGNGGTLGFEADGANGTCCRMPEKSPPKSPKPTGCTPAPVGAQFIAPNPDVAPNPDNQGAMNRAPTLGDNRAPTGLF